MAAVIRGTSLAEQGNAVQSSGEFELGILTQDPAAAAAPDVSPLLAGLEPGGFQTLASLDDMRAAVNKLAAGAQRLLSMYTPDLEPELYDQTPFLDIAKRFVLARNFVKIRVLVGDGRKLARDTNRFVAMGRRLGSYIELRYVQKPIPQRSAGYLIADDRNYVLHEKHGVWSGIADFGSPRNARIVLNEFDAIWMANASDDDLKVAAR